MLSTRKLVAIGAVLAVAASGIALAETMPATIIRWDRIISR